MFIFLGVLLPAFADGPYYVILTTTNIIANSTQLTNFVASKEARGFDVTVVSNTASGWGGGIGAVASTNLKSWLVANYTNSAGDYVIDYVLFLGDPRPLTGDVPMKICEPKDPSPNTSDEYATDLYYADLTSDWDINTNGICGEWDDIDTNDYPISPEVYVGRIPFYGSYTDLDSILSKIVKYETANMANIAWRGKALLAMNHSFIFFNTDELGEWIKDTVLIPSGWEYHRIYDQGGGDSLPSTAEHTVNIWTNSPFGLVCWISHGSETTTDGHVIDLEDVPRLNDDYPVFTFQGACENADPNFTNNLAYSILLNGGIGTVACTRESTMAEGIPYPPTPQSQVTLTPGFEHGFASNLVVNCQWAAPALLNYKASVIPDGSGAWVNYLGYTLYGCPAVGLYDAVGFSGAVISQ